MTAYSCVRLDDAAARAEIIAAIFMNTNSTEYSNAAYFAGQRPAHSSEDFRHTPPDVATTPAAVPEAENRPLTPTPLTNAFFEGDTIPEIFDIIFFVKTMERRLSAEQAECAAMRAAVGAWLKARDKKGYMVRDDEEEAVMKLMKATDAGAALLAEMQRDKDDCFAIAAQADRIAAERDALKAELAELRGQVTVLKRKWESGEPGTSGAIFRGIVTAATELTNTVGSSRPLVLHLRDVGAELKELREQLEIVTRANEQWKRNYNAVSHERDSLRAELKSKTEALEKSENDSDDLWLGILARIWKRETGKEWDDQDGETREEGIASNLEALFYQMEQLRAELSAEQAKSATIEAAWKEAAAHDRLMSDKVIKGQAKSAVLREALERVWFYYVTWNNEESLPADWPKTGDGRQMTPLQIVKAALSTDAIIHVAEEPRELWDTAACPSCPTLDAVRTLRNKHDALLAQFAAIRQAAEAVLVDHEIGGQTTAQVMSASDALRASLSTDAGAALLAERDELKAELEKERAQVERYSGWAKWRAGLWLITHPETGSSAEWAGEVAELKELRENVRYLSESILGYESTIEKARAELAELRECVADICSHLRKKDKSLPTITEVRDMLAGYYAELAELRAFKQQHGERCHEMRLGLQKVIEMCRREAEAKHGNADLAEVGSCVNGPTTQGPACDSAQTSNPDARTLTDRMIANGAILTTCARELLESELKAKTEALEQIARLDYETATVYQAIRIAGGTFRL